MTERRGRAFVREYLEGRRKARALRELFQKGSPHDEEKNLALSSVETRAPLWTRPVCVQRDSGSSCAAGDGLGVLRAVREAFVEGVVLADPVSAVLRELLEVAVDPTLEPDECAR